MDRKKFHSIKTTTCPRCVNPSETALFISLRSIQLDIIARSTAEMSRNCLPPSEEEVEEEEQVVAGEGNRKEAGSDEEDEEEEYSSEKTTSQVRVLDYGSDDDSGKKFPTPSASAFVVKQNSKFGKEMEPKKRLAESDASKEKGVVKKAKREKKKKKGNGAEEDVAVEDKSKRSAGGQRIWGAEDELKILKGMLDYKDETGVDFNSNLEGFYKYIKGFLNAVVDKSQLINKIRKLKEKYRDNAQKEACGVAPVFSKSNEAEAYEHSKKIWRGKFVRQVSQSAKSKPKAKTKVNVAPSAPTLAMDNVLALPVPELEASKKEVIGGPAKVAKRVRKVPRKIDSDEADVEMKGYTIPMPAMEDNFMVKKGLELAEKSKVDALNQKWTKYQLEAAQLYVKKLDLVKEHTKLILDALKSNA